MNILIIDDCFENGEQGSSRRGQINLLSDLGDIVVHEVAASRVLDFFSQGYSAANVYEIIFIDYKFSDSSGAEHGAFHTGDQCISLVRNKCHDTPIYLLSVTISEDQQFERPDGFERQVGEMFLSDTNMVAAEISDHASLRRSMSSGNINEILGLLNCDDEYCLEDLYEALPASVKRNSKSETTTTTKQEINKNKGFRVDFYRWFIDTFYRHPGFLLDDISAANLLGVTPEFFLDNLAEKFNAAKYTGIFHQSLKERWWTSLIKEIVIEADQNDLIAIESFPQASWRIYSDSNEDVQARCVSCHKPWPDAIGYIEEDSSRGLHPIHISCSTRDESFFVSPFFSPPRIIIEE